MKLDGHLPDAGAVLLGRPVAPRRAEGPRADLLTGLPTLPAGVQALLLGGAPRNPETAGHRPFAAELVEATRRLNWFDVGVLAAQAIYLSALQSPLRAGQPAGPAAPDLPADSRFVVADLIQRSTEAFTRMVRGFFETFLGREPAAGEEAGWVTLLLRGWTEEQVLAAFLDTEEFGRRAASLAPGTTADESFVRALHGLLLLRPAAEAELGDWLAALPDLGRARLAHVVLCSTEYRRLRVAAFFEELAGRPGDEGEVAAWAAAPFPLFAVRQIFETRPDLFRNGS
jgi:hypothetical protein